MKPEPPSFPMIHPTTPVQQLRPMLEAYRKQVEAFYNSLQEHYGSDQLGPLVSWGTPWERPDISEEQLQTEIESGQLSPAAIAKLRQKVLK